MEIAVRINKPMHHRIIVTAHEVIQTGFHIKIEALYLVYALNRIGAVSNMIHPLAGEQELAFYLNEVKSEFAFLFDATYKIVKPSLGKTSVRRTIVITAGESLPMGIKQLFFLKNKRMPLPDGDATIWWQQFIKMGKGVC